MSLLCACVSLGGLRMVSQSSWKPHKPLVKYATERQIGLYTHSPPSSFFSTQFFNYPYQGFTSYLIFMCASASISKCTSFSRSEAKIISEPLLHRKQSNLVEFTVSIFPYCFPCRCVFGECACIKDWKNTLSGLFIGLLKFPWIITFCVLYYVIFPLKFPINLMRSWIGKLPQRLFPHGDNMEKCRVYYIKIWRCLLEEQRALEWAAALTTSLISWPWAWKLPLSKLDWKELNWPNLCFSSNSSSNFLCWKSLIDKDIFSPTQPHYHSYADLERDLALAKEDSMPFLSPQIVPENLRWKREMNLIICANKELPPPPSSKSLALDIKIVY